MGGSGSRNQHDIELETERQNNTVCIKVVSGNPAPTLPRNSKAHRFNFTLTDNTGLDVSFHSLDTEDGSNCPPAPGQNSSQIIGDTMNNNVTPKTAGFTDSNCNQVKNLKVTYQWKFTCNDPAVTVEPFDPTITNGGQD